MREYVLPILAVYDPGVILEYESEDIILRLMDNYPEDASEKYSGSFEDLIKEFSNHLPKNLEVKYVRCRNQYPPEKLFQRINEILPKKRLEWARLSEEELKNRLHRTPNNIMWNGEHDWSLLGEEEKQNKILEAKLINDSFYDADFELRSGYFEGDNHIPLVFTFGLGYENISNWLILGSTRSSFVDFWVGRGILEERDSRLITRIVSHEQYNRIKDTLKTSTIKLPYFAKFKNLSQIEIFEGIIR